MTFYPKAFFIGMLAGGILIAAALATATDKGRRGLIIEDLGGQISVRTHPAQPMELGMPRQPRLKIEMAWPKGHPEQTEARLIFIMATKGEELCPEVFIFAAGEWRQIGGARHEIQRTKNGDFEAVIIETDPQMICQIALAKQPAQFNICGREFRIHGIEAEDLREAAEIWRRQ